MSPRGDAVQDLMLDLCGTDMALVKERDGVPARRRSDRLYEESVWDRVQEGSTTTLQLTPDLPRRPKVARRWP